MVWPIVLELGRSQMTLRLFVPEELGLSVTSGERARAAERDLSALPLELSATAGRVRLPLTAAKALALGDVVVLDETALIHEHGHFCGHVGASLPGSGQRISCSIVATGLTVEAFTKRAHSALNQPANTESGPGA